MDPCIIVHGGSRFIPLEDMKERYKTGVQEAAKIGYKTLMKGDSAVDAVESAVRVMEEDHLFNAGYGSALTNATTVEVDALIMDGSTLNAGAVAAVEGIANPVSLARRVMEDTPHCLLASEGAVKFAKKIGFPVLDNPSALITKESHERSASVKSYLEVLPKYVAGGTIPQGEERDKPCHDTVGAVAIDTQGRLACATSTGGLPLKMVGRVGDTPLVGCGGYANTAGASSTTGHGESIMKTVLGREVIRYIENGSSAQEACEKAVNSMLTQVQGYGGVIAIDKTGGVGHAFSTQHMTWASASGGVMTYGQEHGEEIRSSYSF